MTFPCPICGYGLSVPPQDFTICPSCGIEFGYGDAGVSHRELRLEWIEAGAPWSSSVIPKPLGWNPWTQLIYAGFVTDNPFHFPIYPVFEANVSEAEVEIKGPKNKQVLRYEAA